MKKIVVFVTIVSWLCVNGDDTISDCHQCTASFVAGVTLTQLGVSKPLASPINMATCASVSCSWRVTSPLDSWVRVVFESIDVQSIDTVYIFNGNDTLKQPLQRCTEASANCKAVTVQSNVMTIVFNHQQVTTTAQFKASVIALPKFGCGQSDIKLRYTGITQLSSWGYPYSYCPSYLQCTYNIVASDNQELVYSHVSRANLTKYSQLQMYDSVNGQAQLIQTCQDTDCADRTSRSATMKVTYTCLASNDTSHGGFRLFLLNDRAAKTGTQQCGPSEYGTINIPTGTSQIVKSPNYPNAYCGNNVNKWKFTTSKGNYLRVQSSKPENVHFSYYNDLLGREGTSERNLCGISRGPETTVVASSAAASPRLGEAFMFNVTSVPICASLKARNLTYTHGCLPWDRPTYICTTGNDGEYDYADCKFLYTSAVQKTFKFSFTSACQLSSTTKLNLYDGNSISAPQLESYDNCENAGSSSQSSGPNLFIHYKTDKIVNESGKRTDTQICFP